MHEYEKNHAPSSIPEHGQSRDQAISILPPIFQMKVNQGSQGLVQLEKEKEDESIENSDKLDSETVFDSEDPAVPPTKPNSSIAQLKPPPFQLKSEYSSLMHKETLTQMSSSFGQDFSDVNIHTGSKSAVDAGALAYTQGNDIHFAPGQYDPSSQGGQELLGHELTHVVQQREGRVQANSEVNGMPLNDDKGLEQEADQMGAKAAQMQKNNASADTFSKSNTFSNIVQRTPDPSATQSSTSAPTSTAPATTPATTTTAPESSEAEEAKRIFREHGTYGPQGVVPATFSGGSGFGGFDATYDPVSQVFTIDLRGKISFSNSLQLSGGTVTAVHPELAGLATIVSSIQNAAIKQRIVSYYQWDPATKASMMVQFHASVVSASGIWNGTGMSFNVVDAGWEDVIANPHFNIDIEEEGNIDTSSATPGTSDHLQTNVYKSPLPQEIESVNRLIDDNATVSADDTRALRAYVDGDTGSDSYDDTNPYNGSMNLDSNDLLERPEADSRGRDTMLRNNVFFANNSAVLTAEYIAGIRHFMASFSSRGDQTLQNNTVNLIGFASAPGSVNHNRQLVEQRLQAVQEILQSIGVNNITRSVTETANQGSTVTNRGESEANSLPQDSNSQHIERRVEIRIGSGERQNIIAHELGHVFGLGDEYDEEGVAAPGDNAQHNELARASGVGGGAQVENSDNIISMGNTIRPQHFSVFANALNQLTGKTWHVRS